MDAKMCPHPDRSNYFIQVVYYILPETDKDTDTIVRTFKNGRDPVTHYSLLEAFKDDQAHLAGDDVGPEDAGDRVNMFDHCSLKLMSLSPEGTLQEEREIVIHQPKNHSTVNIDFSPDGRFFAILGRESEMLRIYEIPDVPYDEYEDEAE